MIFDLLDIEKIFGFHGFKNNSKKSGFLNDF